MKRLQVKQARQKRRKMRIRRKIRGTAGRPRISVFKSNRHLYVQAIDDASGVTLVSASSYGGETKGLKPRLPDAEKLGAALGEKMKSKQISEAVFDRNGSLYHGVVKAIADGARKAGIRL